MENVFIDLRTRHFWAWGALGLAFIFVSFWVFDPRAAELRGWLALGIYGCVLTFLAPCILAAARKDHRHLLTVCVWSFVAVVLGLIAAFYAHHAFFGHLETSSDKILNLLPVLVAIWAAGLGWLIHYRLTSKAHRTNHAFAMLMRMRTSQEFLERNELVSSHFPPSTQIPEEYDKYFKHTAIREVYEQAAWDPESVDQRELEKAQAIAALKYLLNYYEFFAAGVKAGDLDEELLLDTVSQIVIGMHERSERFIAFVRAEKPAGLGETLAYERLTELCNKWKPILKKREMDAQDQP